MAQRRLGEAIGKSGERHGKGKRREPVTVGRVLLASENDAFAISRLEAAACATILGARVVFRG